MTTLSLGVGLAKSNLLFFINKLEASTLAACASTLDQIHCIFGKSQAISLFNVL